MTKKVSGMVFSATRINAVKGLAIFSVVLLHVFAYFKGIYTNASYNFIFILLDQAMRFCVPSFLILSGYGLAAKYENKSFFYWPFIKKRFLKLLPLYLLWSLVSILIFKLVPVWSSGLSPDSIFTILLLGRADYQLYFLPVIFQLYLLFPFLWLLRKQPQLLFGLSLAVQILFYLYFSLHFSLTDRFEYVLGFSWLGYFGLGIWLRLCSLHPSIIKFIGLMTLTILLSMALFAKRAIDNGLDPLPALKFTRLFVIPLATLVSLWFLFFSAKFHFLGLKAGKVLSFLGKNSYLIFLSHTLGLRIIYAIITAQLSIFTLIWISLLWSAAVYLSLKLKF